MIFHYMQVYKLQFHDLQNSNQSSEKLAQGPSENIVTHCQIFHNMQDYKLQFHQTRAQKNLMILEESKTKICGLKRSLHMIFVFFISKPSFNFTYNGMCNVKLFESSNKKFKLRLTHPTPFLHFLKHFMHGISYIPLNPHVVLYNPS